METLLVVVVVAAAVLWAAWRIRRTVRSATRGAAASPDCAACGAAAGCELAATCGAAVCPETRRAGRPGPPR
jgi:hypothetical protein